MIAWISSFASQFNYGVFGTQISVLLYGNSLSSSIPLNGAADIGSFRNRLAGLQYGTPLDTVFNLAGAIDFTTNTILRSPQGWRNQSTVALFVGISPR